MQRYVILILFSMFIDVSGAAAQELVTDRPDFTESALVVSSKMIQIESGVELIEFNSSSTFSYPIVLARIGIGHNLEARVGFSGWINETIHGNSNTYINDMIFEAKYQITSTETEIPMALLLVSTLPTGDEEVSVENTEIGVKFACSYELNDRMGLAANIGTIATTASSREFISLASIAMGIGMSDKTSSFIELLAEIPEKEAWQPVIDGGVTYLITPVAQADFYVGTGLNAHSPDLIVGAGFSFRFSL